MELTNNTSNLLTPGRKYSWDLTHNTRGLELRIDKLTYSWTDGQKLCTRTDYSSRSLTQTCRLAYRPPSSHSSAHHTLLTNGLCPATHASSCECVQASLKRAHKFYAQFTP